MALIMGTSSHEKVDSRPVLQRNRNLHLAAQPPHPTPAVARSARQPGGSNYPAMGTNQRWSDSDLATEICTHRQDQNFLLSQMTSFFVHLTLRYVLEIGCNFCFQFL